MLGYKDIMTVRNTGGLKFYSCGISRCKPSYIYGPRVRYYHIIHFVVSGKGIFNIDGKQYKLEKGQAFYIPPGKVASYQADLENPWKYCWIGYLGNDAEHFSNQFFMEKSTITKGLDIGEIESKIMKMFVEIVDEIVDIRRAICFAEEEDTHFYIADKLSNHFRLNAVLYEILCQLSKADDTYMSGNSLDISYAERARDFIEGHYYENIGIHEVAKSLNLHTNYLTSLFKKEYNITLKRYLDKVRIEHACRMLLETNFPVKIIAKSIGINNVSVFSQFFSKMTGKSATQYRQIYLTTKEH